MFPRVIEESSRTYQGFRVGRAAVVIVLVIALPYLVQPYQLSQLTGAGILAIAVVGMNALSGFGGQISLGHAAFFGIGAYATGIMTVTYEQPLLLAILTGVVLCFIVGVILGIPALRVKGMYLALVTLSFGVLFPSLVRRFESLTGGSAGLLNIKSPAPDVAYFAGPIGQIVWLYWLMAVTLLLSCLVVWNLMRSRTGRAIVALRDNEAAAIIGGINRTVVRTTLFGVSAGIAGAAGGLFAIQTGLLTPDSFSLLLTINFLVAMVLGGTATYWGPIFGGLAIYFVPEWTADVTGGPIAGVLFGAIVIIMVFAMRSGIVGLIKKAATRFVVIQPRVPRPIAKVVSDDDSNGTSCTPAAAAHSRSPQDLEDPAPLRT